MCIRHIFSHYNIIIANISAIRVSTTTFIMYILLTSAGDFYLFNSASLNSDALRYVYAEQLSSSSPSSSHDLVSYLPCILSCNLYWYSCSNLNNYEA